MIVVLTLVIQDYVLRDLKQELGTYAHKNSWRQYFCLCHMGSLVLNSNL